MPDCSISIANALEILQSRTKLSYRFDSSRIRIPMVLIWYDIKTMEAIWHSNILWFLLLHVFTDTHWCHLCAREIEQSVVWGSEHYLYKLKCWLDVNWTFRKSIEWKLYPNEISNEMCFKCRANWRPWSRVNPSLAQTNKWRLMAWSLDYKKVPC